MSAVVAINGKGRILLPKSIREIVSLKEGGYARVRVEEGAVIIEPVKSIAEEYFGAYRVERWPEDIDRFLAEAVRRW